MSIGIRLPNINAPTEAGRLEQMRSYLYQMSEQLNWALKNLEKGISNTDTIVHKLESGSSGNTPEVAQKNFASVKALIIKSADIVNSYYQTISEKLKGEYEALSDYGTFKEETVAEFEKTSKAFTEKFENIQTIISELEDFKDETIKANAYIKSGLLDEDANGPIYGLEIGQETTIGGEKVFDKFARFTSDKLSFYNTNGTEVAYISDFKLFITNAEILGSLFHGGYEEDSSDGIAYIWRGRR